MGPRTERGLQIHNVNINSTISNASFPQDGNKKLMPILPSELLYKEYT
jgi:hypothetical protein